MSAELSAIDKLITLLKKLPSAMPGAHKRMFEEYVSPAYDLMRLIHVDYIQAFHSARKKLYDPDYLTIANPSKRLKQQLEAVTETILKRREKYEGKRDLLRQEAQAYIVNLDAIEMRRFFIAVCDYLVLDDDKGFIWIGNERDQFIEGVAEKGGLTKYDTPSTQFLRQIKSAESTDEAGTIIKGVLEHLNTKYFNVANTYTEIETRRHIF